MSLVLQLLNCNACGGPLDVAPSTHFVTCGHCESRLAIQRTGTSAFTEVLDRIENKVDQTAERVAEIARRDRLRELDGEWLESRKRFLGTADDVIPDPDFDRSVRVICMAVGVLICFVGIILGIFSTGSRDGHTGLMALPIVFAGLGLFILSLVYLGKRVAEGQYFLSKRAEYMNRRASIQGDSLVPITVHPDETR